MQPSRALGVLIVVVTGGCCLGGGDAPAATSGASTSSCNMPSLSTCTQYGHTSLGEDLLVGAMAQGLCEQLHGQFTQTACPTEGVVATCPPNEAGDVTMFYGSGATPYTAESGQAACTAAAAPATATTELPAPPADAVSYQTWCDEQTAWTCTNCRPDLEHDACTSTMNGLCLMMGYPATTMLSLRRADLDRCLADQQTMGCAAQPASCRVPPVAPGTTMDISAWCIEVASVQCDACDHDAWVANFAACQNEHSPACVAGRDLSTPAGTPEDLARCLVELRAATCGAPLPASCSRM